MEPLASLSSAPLVVFVMTPPANKAQPNPTGEASVVQVTSPL